MSRQPHWVSEHSSFSSTTMKRGATKVGNRLGGSYDDNRVISGLPSARSAAMGGTVGGGSKLRRRLSDISMSSMTTHGSTSEASSRRGREALAAYAAALHGPESTAEDPDWITRVWAWGCSANGQCLDGHESHSQSGLCISRPRWLRQLETGAYRLTAPPRRLACGRTVTAVITEAGQVASWGTGPALGREHSVKHQRVLVEGLSEIVEVAIGEDHGLACTRSGELFAWGLNTGGKLGLGDTVTRLLPQAVASGPLQQVSIVSVACGQQHSAALAADGTLFTFGTGKAGQLGHGDLRDQHRPKRVQAFDGLPVAGVACGANHTAAFLQDGRLLTWGWGEHGRLGTGDEETVTTPAVVTGAMEGRVVTAVACGTAHTLAVIAYSVVYAFGWNEFGQVRRKPQVVVTPASSSSADAHILSPVRVMDINVGMSGMSDDELEGLPSIVKVSAGFAHSAVLTSEGKLYTWGFGEEGQLGNGDEVSVGLPMEVELPADELSCSCSSVALHVVDVCLGHCHSAAIASRSAPAQLEALMITQRVQRYAARRIRRFMRMVVFTARLRRLTQFMRHGANNSTATSLVARKGGLIGLDDEDVEDEQRTQQQEQQMQQQALQQQEEVEVAESQDVMVGVEGGREHGAPAEAAGVITCQADGEDEKRGEEEGKVSREPSTGGAAISSEEEQLTADVDKDAPEAGVDGVETSETPFAEEVGVGAEEGAAPAPQPELEDEAASMAEGEETRAEGGDVEAKQVDTLAAVGGSIDGEGAVEGTALADEEVDGTSELVETKDAGERAEVAADSAVQKQEAEAESAAGGEEINLSAEPVEGGDTEGSLAKTPEDKGEEEDEYEEDFTPDDDDSPAQEETEGAEVQVTVVHPAASEEAGDEKLPVGGETVSEEGEAGAPQAPVPAPVVESGVAMMPVASEESMEEKQEEKVREDEAPQEAVVEATQPSTELLPLADDAVASEAHGTVFVGASEAGASEEARVQTEPVASSVVEAAPKAKGGQGMLARRSASLASLRPEKSKRKPALPRAARTVAAPSSSTARGEAIAPVPRRTASTSGAPTAAAAASGAPAASTAAAASSSEASVADSSSAKSGGSQGRANNKPLPTWGRNRPDESAQARGLKGRLQFAAEMKRRKAEAAAKLDKALTGAAAGGPPVAATLVEPSDGDVVRGDDVEIEQSSVVLTDEGPKTLDADEATTVLAAPPVSAETSVRAMVPTTGAKRQVGRITKVQGRGVPHLSPARGSKSSLKARELATDFAYFKDKYCAETKEDAPGGDVAPLVKPDFADFVRSRTEANKRTPGSLGLKASRSLELMEPQNLERSAAVDAMVRRSVKKMHRRLSLVQLKASVAPNVAPARQQAVAPAFIATRKGSGEGVSESKDLGELPLVEEVQGNDGEEQGAIKLPVLPRTKAHVAGWKI